MAPMTYLTPSPPADGESRNAHSTTNGVSGGTSGGMTSRASIAASTPLTPLEARHPTGEISTDLPHAKAEPSPNFEIPGDGNVDAYVNRIASKMTMSRQRTMLLATRSDPSGLYSMTTRELSEPVEVPLNKESNDRGLFSTSPHVGSSSNTESSAGGGSCGTASSAEPPASPGSYECCPSSQAMATENITEKAIMEKPATAKVPTENAVVVDAITAKNAQACLSPEACIFVASLRRDKSDSELLKALLQQFSIYGKCYVKVKRDRGLPIAFVQYHEKAQATDAMEFAAGLPILGRPCRIEKARAPRSVFICRRDGFTLKRSDILNFAESIGEVDMMWSPSTAENGRFGVLQGLIIKFRYYQDSVNALLFHRDNPVYYVEPFQGADSARSTVFAKDSFLMEPSAISSCPFFDGRVHAPNALWIGCLPRHVTKAEISQVFTGRGNAISQVELRIRGPAGSKYSYAIVRFNSHDEAIRAAKCTHHRLRLVNGELVSIQWAVKPNLRHLVGARSSWGTRGFFAYPVMYASSGSGGSTMYPRTTAEVHGNTMNHNYELNAAFDAFDAQARQGNGFGGPAPIFPTTGGASIMTGAGYPVVNGANPMVRY